MAVPLLPLAQAIWGGIVAIVLALAGNVGGDVVADRFAREFGNHALEREVTRAIDRAYRRFTREVRDPELVAAIERDPRFANDPQVVRLLSEVATRPQFERRQVSALAQRMHALVPYLPPIRCERAAAVLVEAIHAEVSTIRPLQMGLVYLRGQQIQAALDRLPPVPPYAPGLRAALIAEADAVQRELGQRYITSAHLLYALTRPPAAIAREVLQRHHVASREVKEALRRTIKPYTGPVPDAMAAGAVSALEEAQQAARRHDAQQTRDDHLLEVLATRVAQEGEGSTSLTPVFRLLDLPAEQVRDEAIAAGRIESALQSFTE